MSINTATLMGRLCSDPEVRSTQNGKNVCNFTLAVDNRGENADFIPCTAWEKTADFIGKWFHKGDMIAVTGRIRSRKYTDKDGNNRTAIELVVNEASFCGGKNESNVVNTAKRPSSREPFEAIDGDDDLPFD